MGDISFSPIPVEFFCAFDTINKDQEMGLQAIANTEEGSDIDTLNECMNACNYLRSLNTSKEDINLAGELCYDVANVPNKQEGNSVVTKKKGKIIRFTLNEDGSQTVHDLITGETLKNYFTLGPVHNLVYNLMSNGTYVYLISEHGVYQSNPYKCGSYFDFSCIGEPYYVRSENTMHDGCDKLKELFFNQQDDLMAKMIDGRSLSVMSLEPESYCWHKIP